MKRSLAAAALVLSACAPDAAEELSPPAGGPPMVVSSDGSALYVAGADDDLVARVDAETLEVVRAEVPGEPTRVARIGDRILVTLRAERTLLELVDDGTALIPGRRIEVGAEPVGVVATGDGARVYVAASLAGRVIELDGDSLEKKREWIFEAEPRWLALHPSGRTLYVGTTAVGGLHAIDLVRGEARGIPLPVVESFAFTPEPVVLTGRVTGDPAASPNGRTVAFPMLFVDNTTPIDESEPPREIGGGYGGRMTPTVVLLSVQPDGTPADARVVGIFAGETTGYASSLAFTPDGSAVAATIEGAALVALVAVRSDEPRAQGVAFHATSILKTSSGPRSVAFRGDQGFVYGFLGRRVGRFSIAWMQGANLLEHPEVPASGSVHAQNVLTGARLPPNVEEGRRLFYATNIPSVARGGVSCATCHFDGRTDGLTWRFDRGPRQTPSLAGVVSAREPVRWGGERATVAEDARLASSGLMGGTGLTAKAADDIAAYVDFTRRVDLPSAGAEVERGREIFSRPDVGCAGCHSGAIYSDGRLYDMLGFDGVKTPSLLGVAATAPYFHDGSAPTLRAVLDAARFGVMGNTSSLDEAEMAALEVFLRSL